MNIPPPVPIQNVAANINSVVPPPPPGQFVFNVTAQSALIMLY